MDLLEETKARKTASLKDALQSENNILESLIKEQNDEYNILKRENVHKKVIIHNYAETKLLEGEKRHSNRISEVEREYERQISKRDQQVKLKDNEFKGRMAAVEKSIQVEKKKYEDDRRKAQKAYEVEVKKSIAGINKKLDLESRLV